MNKDTLYITFDGLSDPLGQSQILPYLCGIAKNGYSITILSCEKKERLDKEKENILNIIKGLPVSWQYILYDEAGNFISRFSYIRKLNVLAKKVHKEKKVVLIHCRSYLASLIGLKFKLKYNTPFIFDMRGFWADERIDGGIWKKSNTLHAAFYNYFKKKEIQFIKNCSAIISLTNAAVDELSKVYTSGFIKSKTTVIPCCTNTELFSKENLQKKISIAGISENDHVVIYTGSIGTWYFTREMINCIIEWKALIPNIRLLIVTRDNTELERILKEYSPADRSLIVTTSASYKEVPSYLALAKAAMFFIKPSYSKIASSPTKMAECWAMDLPIITNSGIGDNDLYFNKHKGGVLIDGFTNADYKTACEKYLYSLQSSTDYRALALNYFDTKNAIKSYTSVYNSLTG